LALEPVHRSNVPNRDRRSIGLANDSRVSPETYLDRPVENRLQADDVGVEKADRWNSSTTTAQEINTP
jgi:hypothetical protein